MATFDIGYLESFNHMVTTFHYCYLEGAARDAHL
jgi:hypothetical protein